ncbi:MAG TPA: TonB-dependent receptor [Sphingomicrobium sp.]
MSVFRCLGALCCLIPASAFAQALVPQAPEDLSGLSIEELANIQVRSASKRDQPLSAVPASIYVIDHDQIVRSAALTIPEMLRLAPNLQVYQQSPSHWVVTARGLDGDPSAQSFSNKLLVMIDGRTVYTPLFSGVYWDLPDLLPDDIDRIEVISGPGATLWGANAVNGVINIITRGASTASRAFADIDAGTGEQVVGLRLGGHVGADLSYRAYARWIHEDAAEAPGGGSAGDSWHRLGGGFRADWTPTKADNVTFQGDIFGGVDELPGSPHESISGRNLMVRWDRDTAPGQQLQVQAFYDRIARGQTPSSPRFHVDTYDVDLQHSLTLGSANQLVWGGGARVARYDIQFTPSFYFDPSSRSLFLANLFVQDTLAVSDALKVTAGLKAEHDPYVGFSLLPDVRVALQPSKNTLLWAAVSHAVRSPTPFDVDAQERVGNLVALSGDPVFRTEKLTAYELGLRTQPMAGLSLSVTGFYHHYDDLRTVELTTGPAALNLAWANGLAGHSYGVEAWATASPLPWWTVAAGTTLLHEDFHFKPGSSKLLGPWQNGVDPSHQVTLRSSMNLGKSVTFDLDFRALGQLHHGDVPAYAELGGRLAWSVSDQLTLTLAGENLLHAHHVEYPGGDAIPRKVLAGLQWRL